jgi:hypothetical protein
MKIKKVTLAKKLKELYNITTDSSAIILAKSNYGFNLMLVEGGVGMVIFRYGFSEDGTVIVRPIRINSLNTDYFFSS